MRAAAYDVTNVSLVAANADTEIVGHGIPTRGVYVRKLAVATEVQVKLGKEGKLFTLRQGEGVDVEEGGEPITSGVYLTAAAGGVGATAEIMIVKDTFRVMP